MSSNVVDDESLVAASRLSTMNLGSLTGRANLAEEVSRHWALNCLRKEPLFDQKMFDRWAFESSITGDTSSLGNNADLRARVEQVYVGVMKNRRGRGTEAPVLAVVNRGGQWDVTVGRVTLRCPNALYQRLKRAHSVHSVTTDFHEDLARVLLRYDAVNAGHQIAVLPAVMQLFHDKLDVAAECFASPINAQSSRFCSAFIDSDCSFGSLGSFFDFRPSTGSFELNPPFVEAYLQKIHSHVESLLTNAVGPLQFIVVVPRWQKKKCYQDLAASSWVSRSIHLKLKEHQWINCTTGKKKDASNKTSVLFFQNEEAKKKWPVTAELVSEIKQAFRGDIVAPKRARTEATATAAAPRAQKVKATGQSNWEKLQGSMKKTKTKTRKKKKKKVK